MLLLMQGAVYSQLAVHLQLPAPIQERIQKMARERAPDKIVTYLQDQSISINNSRNDTKKIRQMLEVIREVNRDVVRNEDCGTLIANYESVTGSTFPKPAWISMEMNKIDL